MKQIIKNTYFSYPINFEWEYKEIHLKNIVEGSSLFDLAKQLLSSDKKYPQIWKYFTIKQYLLAGFSKKCEILEASMIDEISKTLLHEYIIWKCTNNLNIIYMSIDNFIKQSLFSSFIVPSIWSRITLRDYFEANISEKNNIIKYMDDLNTTISSPYHVERLNLYNESHKPSFESNLTCIFVKLITENKLHYDCQTLTTIYNSLQLNDCRSLCCFSKIHLEKAIKQLSHRVSFEKYLLETFS